ncbi:MAG: hypothetical protein GY801_13490 [bacterium]|nr:hypothetical protein [bacterium]
MTDKIKIDALVFVYNANSGKISAFLDSAKKVLMVDGCVLCTLTHGILGEKKEWKECQEELGVPIRYYHRDDLSKILENIVDGRFPCILAQIGTHYMMLLEPEVLERCRADVRDLKGRISYYLAANDLTL